MDTLTTFAKQIKEVGGFFTLGESYANENRDRFDEYGFKVEPYNGVYRAIRVRKEPAPKVIQRTAKRIPKRYYQIMDLIQTHHKILMRTFDNRRSLRSRVPSYKPTLANIQKDPSVYAFMMMLEVSGFKIWDDGIISHPDFAFEYDNVVAMLYRTLTYKG